MVFAFIYGVAGWPGGAGGLVVVGMLRGSHFQTECNTALAGDIHAPRYRPGMVLYLLPVLNPKSYDGRVWYLSVYLSIYVCYLHI